MPPLAALGKHQSRWNYITPEDVMEAESLKVMVERCRKEQKE
jgi:hypothetical protein